VSKLELRDVSKSYSTGEETLRVLDSVSLTIESGEFVALYGPSGSGKTTLLLLIAGLLRPDAGSVAFDGREITRMSERDSAHFRRKDVGFVFQAFHLSGGANALDNATTKLIGDGLTLREARRQARPWIERVGLRDRAERMPAQLSMGERQRVAIARALTGDPHLLLADEPTGNLDSRRSRDILALLRDMCHERSIPGLLVTHDPEALAFVDRVLSLRDGRLQSGFDSDLAAAISI
jgi:putative ABC transport system ATP-binding protein